MPEHLADVDAFSFWWKGTPFVLLNTRQSAERGRFDAVHELGHLVMHSDYDLPRGRERELEANRFAAAFLMPEQDVLACGLRNANASSAARYGHIDCNGPRTISGARGSAQRLARCVTRPRRLSNYRLRPLLAAYDARPYRRQTAPISSDDRPQRRRAQLGNDQPGLAPTFTRWASPGAYALDTRSLSRAGSARISNPLVPNSGSGVQRRVRAATDHALIRSRPWSKSDSVVIKP
ncbi:MAG: ImmA/IrrE family metallo-endopeptidase [Actinomycetota bacterium]|nr:ImmA/IrrE family metallo-endopeptidase [Actinomycetota bacterium]